MQDLRERKTSLTESLDKLREQKRALGKEILDLDVPVEILKEEEEIERRKVQDFKEDAKYQNEKVELTYYLKFFSFFPNFTPN